MNRAPNVILCPDNFFFRAKKKIFSTPKFSVKKNFSKIFQNFEFFEFQIGLFWVNSAKYEIEFHVDIVWNRFGDLF